MVEKVNKREDSISVKGVAERKVKANKGVLILTLMRSNKTAEDAYSKLEEDLTTIKDEITILDLVENEIEYSNIKTEPIYNGNTKEILSYNVYQTITITTNKVDTLANTSLELSKLTLKLPNLDSSILVILSSNFFKKESDYQCSRCGRWENRRCSTLWT